MVNIIWRSLPPDRRFRVRHAPAKCFRPTEFPIRSMWFKYGTEPGDRGAYSAKAIHLQTVALGPRARPRN